MAIQFYDNLGRPLEDTELYNLRRHLADGGTLLEWINDDFRQTNMIITDSGDLRLMPNRCPANPDVFITHIHADGRTESVTLYDSHQI